jgi:hypothetical protein
MEWICRFLWWSEPFRVKSFHAPFQPAPISARCGEVRSDHMFGLAPIKIQLTVAFLWPELANFSNVELSHLQNDALTMPHVKGVAMGGIPHFLKRHLGRSDPIYFRRLPPKRNISTHQDILIFRLNALAIAGIFQRQRQSVPDWLLKD